MADRDPIVEQALNFQKLSSEAFWMLLSLNGQVAKLTDQMDAVLDSLTQINRRLDALEQR